MKAERRRSDEKPHFQPVTLINGQNRVFEAGTLIFGEFTLINNVRGWKRRSQRSETMSDGVGSVICPLLETGPGNLRNSEASVIELNDGRLLLAYTHFYADADDFGAGDIRGKLSEDGGRTWSKPFLIHPNTARYNTGRLALLHLPEMKNAGGHWPSVIAMVYVDLNDLYHFQIAMTTSIDSGRNWSTPININPTGMLGHVCQRGDGVIVTRAGRIVVPAYAMFAGTCASFMFLSDDRGNTWRRSSGEIAVQISQDGHRIGISDFEEPAVAQLRDGRLICFGRTRMGQIYQSFSSDDGMTWSDPTPTGLASSYSPSSLKVIPSTGDLLCVWNQVSGQEVADGLGRMRMSCAVSKDDGESWTHFQNLESLDDTVRVEPEDAGGDSVSELHAIQRRLALKVGGTKTRYPDEVTARYPRWPGYISNDYPSVLFTRGGNVVFTYGASDYETAGLTVGLKIVVRPVSWLYEGE
jgi:hypothetical protein